MLKLGTLFRKSQLSLSRPSKLTLYSLSLILEKGKQPREQLLHSQLEFGFLAHRLWKCFEQVWQVIWGFPFIRFEQNAHLLCFFSLTLKSEKASKNSTSFAPIRGKMSNLQSQQAQLASLIFSEAKSFVFMPAHFTWKKRLQNSHWIFFATNLEHDPQLSIKWVGISLGWGGREVI